MRGVERLKEERNEFGRVLKVSLRKVMSSPAAREAGIATAITALGTEMRSGDMFAIIAAFIYLLLQGPVIARHILTVCFCCKKILRYVWF